MAIIGNFTKQDNGYQGTIVTLSVSAKATITPIEKTGEQAPDFRVFAGRAEIGAVWSATSKAGNAYISVKLDDPSFPAPVVCRLLESDRGHALVWTRQPRKAPPGRTGGAFPLSHPTTSAFISGDVNGLTPGGQDCLSGLCNNFLLGANQKHALLR